MSFENSTTRHVESGLMRESLVDKGVIARSEGQVSSILPDVNVIQIGGSSIMDRGRSALLPLLDPPFSSWARPVTPDSQPGGVAAAAAAVIVGVCVSLKPPLLSGGVKIRPKVVCPSLVAKAASPVFC